MSSNILTEACQTFLKRVADVTQASRNVNPDAADDFVTKAFSKGINGRKPTLFSMYNEFVINGMISGLGTPIVNIISNMTQLLLRPTLEVIKAAMKLDPKALREATAMWSAMADGWASDMVFFGRGFRSGTPFDYEISARSLGMTEKQFREAMTEAGVPTDIDGNIDPNVAQELLRDSYDYMTKSIPGPLGKIVRIPSNLTVAIDEYFKARLRNQKTMQLLSRKAQEESDAGKGSYEDLYKVYKQKWLSKANPEDYANSINELFGDASTALYDVRAYAKDNTFQTELTGVLKKIQEARGGGGTFGQTALIQAIPFLRTPWNLVKQGVSYVPVAGYVLRPNETKAVARLIKDGTETMVSTEVARMSREDAIARQIVGFGAVASVYGMIENGMITGSMPSDPAERARWENNGIPPFSIKVGDKWISYAKVEPLATVFGIAADGFEFQRYAEQEGLEDDRYVKEAGKQFAAALKANVLQKSFMEGFANLMAALESPNMAENYLNSLAQRLVPALSNTIARATDPVEREAQTALERIKSRIPVLREQLPVRQRQYGEPAQPAMIGDITGIAVAPEQTEQQKLLDKIGVGVSKPQRKIGGVELNTEQYGYYMQKINERTTRYINGLDLPRLAKLENRKIVRKRIEDGMKRLRQAAQYDLVRAYPELRTAVINEKRFKLGLPEIE